MPIVIYDKFGEQLENIEFEGKFTDFLMSVPGYDPVLPLPFSVVHNGRVAGCDFFVCRDETVEITVEPQEVTTWVYIAITLLSAAYSYYTMSNLPKNYQNTTESGGSIYSPKASANSIVPNGIIREVAGEVTIYPDLICQPHRRYDNNEEWLYLALCLGDGHFDTRDDSLYIAETQAKNYTSDIVANYIEPDQDNSSVVAMQNWFPSKEVQNLRLTTVGKPLYGVWTVDYSGSTVTSYLDGVATEFPFVAGERFEIFSGVNAGIYEVAFISGSSNESALVVELELDSEESGRLEIISQIVYSRDTTGKLIRNTFNSLGSPVFTSATGVVADWTSITGGVNWEGPIQCTPVNELCRYAEIDVRFPGGLGELGPNNEVLNKVVQIAIEWRAFGQTVWNEVAGTTYTDSTYNEKAFTIDLDFGSYIRPEFRFRRITEDSGTSSIFDIVEIVRVKCLLSSPSSYPVTTIGVKLRGTNALSSTAENRINVRGAPRKLPALAELESGSWDLSDAATKVSSPWQIIDPDYAFNFQCTNLGDIGDVSISASNITFNSAGTKALVCRSSNRFMVYTCQTPFKFDGSQIYNGYYLGGSVDYADEQKAQHAYGDYWAHIMRSKSPGAIFQLEVKELSIPDSGEYVETSSTAYSYGIGGVASVESFDLTTDGLNALVTEVSILKRYALGTAWDISTIGSSLSSYDFITNDSRAVDHICIGNFESSQPVSLYLLSSGTIYEYEFATAGDPSTLTDTGRSFSSTGIDHIQFYIDGFYLSTTNSGIGFYEKYDMDVLADNRATRSIARFVGWMLVKSGVPSDQIDWTGLSGLDSTWSTRTDYLDAEFSDETVLSEALKIALAPGYAEPTLKEGKLIPVRSAAGSNYENIYTPDVMTGEGLRIETSHYDDQEPDGVDVEYFDADSNGVQIVECRLAGDLGIRPKRINAIGITDGTKAWRYGMRERRRLRFKPENMSFETEMDALNSEYGEPVLLCSTLFGSESGSVVGYSGSVLDLDFDPDMGSGTWYASLRKPNGNYSGFYTIAYGPSPGQITLSSPTTLDFTPVYDGSQDSTMISIGQVNPLDPSYSSGFGTRAIIRSIEPSSDSMVSVVAEEYVAEVFADDDNSPS